MTGLPVRAGRAQFDPAHPLSVTSLHGVTEPGPGDIPTSRTRLRRTIDRHASRILP